MAVVANGFVTTMPNNDSLTRMKVVGFVRVVKSTTPENLFSFQVQMGGDCSAEQPLLF